GARNQNTAGQPQRSTSTPPSSGPPAEPSACIVVNTASAVLRRSSGNRLVTRAGAQLKISAAPMPCRNRQKSSQPKLGGAAQQIKGAPLHKQPARQQIKAAPFHSSPARKTRAWPNMSPTRPKASIRLAWVRT